MAFLSASAIVANKSHTGPTNELTGIRIILDLREICIPHNNRGCDDWRSATLQCQYLRPGKW